jgi:hypothetical protein
MKSNIQKSRSLGLCVWALFIFMAGSFGCSKDDPEPSVFIKTQETQVSFTNVNACDVGGGTYYTRFYFTIPYETSPDVEIANILYSVAAGGTPVEGEKDSFDDNGTEISFSLCLRFAGAPQVDFTTTLVSEEGLKSSTNAVKINKPSGAN